MIRKSVIAALTALSLAGAGLAAAPAVMAAPSSAPVAVAASYAKLTTKTAAKASRVSYGG